MTSAQRRLAAVRAVRAYLGAEGLVLCRAPDTGFPLDGERELGALVGAVDAVADEWDETTGVTPAEQLAELARSCARL